MSCVLLPLLFQPSFRCCTGYHQDIGNGEDEQATNPENLWMGLIDLPKLW